LKLIPPGVILVVFFVLILSAVFYAALPYRRRVRADPRHDRLGFSSASCGITSAYPPSHRPGQPLPAAVFALLLQPLARFVRARREPKEPAETQSRTS
jgi:hypothetical protein